MDKRAPNGYSTAMAGWLARGTLLAGFLLPLMVLAACGARRPVLYPNERLDEVGAAVARQDIDACIASARDHGARAGERTLARDTAVGGGTGAAAGAVGGAIWGHAGRGAASGAAAGATAGLVHGLLRKKEPSRAYMSFVNACLRDKGYEVAGWR